jgi:hypothetical protein
MSEEQLFTTLKDQESISQKIVLTNISNLTKIRTWQGKAIVTERKIASAQKNSVISPLLTYEVDFAYDVPNQYEAWDNKFDKHYIHTRENSFVRDGNYYFLLTERPEKNKEAQSHLNISSHPLPLTKRFDPFAESSPVIKDYVKFRFSMTIPESRINGRKEQGFSKEENQKWIQDIQANGFKDYVFKVDGHIVTREYRRSGSLDEIFIIDLAQGAVPVVFKDFGGDGEQNVIRSWEATYQNTNGVWIPKKTITSNLMGDGSKIIKEMEWIDQKINKEIPFDRFSLKAIGAVHGMDVRDYRIDSSYKASGDEYPVEHELSTSSFSFFRITCV